MLKDISIHRLLICIPLDPGIDQRDPRWVGAWWLGFVICGVCISIWGLTLFMFPPKVTGADSPEASGVEKNVLRNIKGLISNNKSLRQHNIYCGNMIFLFIMSTLL